MKQTGTSSEAAWTVDPSSLGRAGTVLLESIRRDAENRSTWIFTDPVAMVVCNDPSMLEKALARIEQATQAGLYAAGFISYEARQAWIPREWSDDPVDFPLLWFGLYERVHRTDDPLILPTSEAFNASLHASFDVSRPEYRDAVHHILGEIRNGETYQVNYTVRLKFLWEHDPVQLYLLLRRIQPVPFGAFINCGGSFVASFSPELFLKKRGDILETRPMKGTAPRGSDPRSDEEKGLWLARDPKNRAENLMIVDLMRNDLGKIALAGSVEVFEPFRVEPYRHLYQMTSGVRCRIRNGAGIKDILQATFPPGSVTGAPKINTIRIISSVEDSLRNVYTGAIGFFEPNGDLTLSVAIRTIVGTAPGHCEMGVGSGIVADSEPEKEYEETVLKTRFLLNGACGTLDLVETMLLSENGSVPLLEDHLERMARSAAELDYPFVLDKALTAVRDHIPRKLKGPAVIRLLLTVIGDHIAELLPCTSFPEGPKVATVSSLRTDPGDPLLRHKTTGRRLYDTELARVRKEGHFEVLFVNTDGYLTEGAFTNLFISSNTGWKTPDPDCGLLPGIWRRSYLRSTKGMEAKLTLEAFAQADRVVIGNSVRGTMEIDEVLDEKGHLLYRKGE